MSDSPIEDPVDLFETAPCGYLSLSPDSRIVMVNRTLAQWLGFDSGALVGKSIHELLSFGGRIAFETHLSPLMRMQGHVNEIALDLLAVNGNRVPMIGNAAERRGADGKHQFTRFALFKAVDRRGYERFLLQGRDDAEAETRAERERSVLREQFIAVLGHDLRNPLAAIGAGSGLLEREDGLSDRGRLIVREMQGSVERAMGLIDDVLDFARGSLGGGIVVERHPTDLCPVLEQVVDELRAVSPDHAVETHFDLAEPVLCDPGRIAQLVSNLLANALTHGDPGKPVRLDARIDGADFLLSISNGGEPIPAEVRDQLFMPFFRGAVRPSRNGLGLGLFISSEIAKAHGGALEVTSTEEETRFTLRMPLRGGDVVSESRGSSE